MIPLGMISSGVSASSLHDPAVVPMHATSETIKEIVHEGVWVLHGDVLARNVSHTLHEMLKLLAVTTCSLNDHWDEFCSNVLCTLRIFAHFGTFCSAKR